MKSTILTVYVLIWPIMSALVLLWLTRGVIKDMREAKRKGEHLV